MLTRQGVNLHDFLIESAGTHAYKVGQPPFQSAVEAGRKRGYEVANRAARAVSPLDFDRFDHILAMDSRNITHLRTICPTHYKQKVELLLEYGEEHYGGEIKDPYGGPVEDFERALGLIEEGCLGLVSVLLRAK